MPNKKTVFSLLLCTTPQPRLSHMAETDAPFVAMKGRKLLRTLFPSVTSSSASTTSWHFTGKSHPTSSTTLFRNMQLIRRRQTLTPLLQTSLKTMDYCSSIKTCPKNL
jgi:hypothetical protein